MRVTLLAVAAAEPSCYSRLTNEWVCLDYLRDRRSDLVDATVEHLAITLAAVALGMLIAFPLALLARRLPRLETSVLGFSTGLYTVPSLALFPLLVPFTGLSATTVVIGLALYALTILVRAVLEGLRAVPDDVRESATGLGYGASRLLFRVELPLALPVIMAGLRVATVSTVALTTVGSLVAYGGLGNLIKDGVSTNFRAELFTASVLCVVLAVVLDVLIVLVQRLLTPWTRGVSTG
jgi:osmoprotectant transport system permease protein